MDKWTLKGEKEGTNKLEDMKDAENGEAKVKNVDEESYLGGILTRRTNKTHQNKTYKL